MVNLNERYTITYLDIGGVCSSGEVRVDHLLLVEISLHKLRLDEAGSAVHISVGPCRGEGMGAWSGGGATLYKIQTCVLSKVESEMAIRQKDLVPEQVHFVEEEDLQVRGRK